MQLAKIIKMDFCFGNLMHSALVSVRGDRDDSFIHVQLLQSFFKKVFGVEHIRFRNLKGQLELEEASYPFMRQIAFIISSQINRQFSQYPEAQLRAIRD